MKNQQKRYTPEEKADILMRHNVLGLEPTVFYRRQKEFFENGAAAFQPRRHTLRP